jgi:relaxase-like protein
MIGKAPRAGTGIKGLVSYLMMGKRGEPSPDRVRWTEVRNLGVDDPKLVPRIMRSTANHVGRCDRPFYHFVVAWRHDENPTDQQMRLVGDTTLADLNLLDHQTLFVAHHDTSHRHLHVVVNRVHPDTGKAWDRWQDWVRIERSLARQAKSLGFIYVPGRHNAPQQFEQVAVRPRTGEYRMAERLGTLDKLRPHWTRAQIAERRKDIAAIVERSKSWDELARALAAVNLTVERKGQGLVIGDDSGTLKLSDLGKLIRLGGLEQHFGESFAAYQQRRDQVISVPQPLIADEESGPPPAAQPTAPIQPMPPPQVDQSTNPPDAAQPEPSVAATPHRQRAPIPLPPLSLTPKVAAPSDSDDATGETAPAVPGAAPIQDAGAPSGPRKPKPARQLSDPHTPPTDRTAFVEAWQRRAAESELKRRLDQKRREEDKARREQLRREAREQREEAKAARAAAPPSPPAPPEPAQPPTQPQQRTVPVERPSDPKQKAKSEAYDTKATAEAAADLAHISPDPEAYRAIQPLLGETHNIFSGEKKPLVHAHELAGRDYADDVVAVATGEYPGRFAKRYYFKDAALNRLTELPPPSVNGKRPPVQSPAPLGARATHGVPTTHKPALATPGAVQATRAAVPAKKPIQQKRDPVIRPRNT